MAKHKPKPIKKRGPKADRLVLKGPWKAAVFKALKKGKPPAPKKENS